MGAVRGLLLSSSMETALAVRGRQRGKYPSLRNAVRSICFTSITRFPAPEASAEISVAVYHAIMETAGLCLWTWTFLAAASTLPTPACHQSGYRYQCRFVTQRIDRYSPLLVGHQRQTFRAAWMLASSSVILKSRLSELIILRRILSLRI